MRQMRGRNEIIKNKYRDVDWDILGQGLSIQVVDWDRLGQDLSIQV